jgi:hypothetical protein
MANFRFRFAPPWEPYLRDVPALLRDISVLFFSKWPWRSRDSSSVYLLNSSCYLIFLLPPQKHETRDVVVCGAGEVVEEDG